MIMALTTYKYSLGKCGFEYNWEFATNYKPGSTFGIFMDKTDPYNASCGFKEVKSTIFYIKTWECRAPYIYFNLTLDMCQDGCSFYYYENITDEICE